MRLEYKLLACVVVHVWTHFVGVYLSLTSNRLERSSFLSARNAVDAEVAAEYQSNRLNNLLSAFLPNHLIAPARHQITLYNPHLYAEHYSQVTVCYGKLVGFEKVLSQCSSIDAARVLKELDMRIDRLTAQNGCVRIASDGVTAVCSVPSIDSEHAIKLCNFAIELEALINSFRDATTAEVSVCVGIDSGSISGGIVGSTKWHYDILGDTVDSAILLQSSVIGSGVFVSNETRRQLGSQFRVEPYGNYWKLVCDRGCSEMFPISKRFSLMTAPQAINRLLQGIAAIDPSLKTMATSKRRKSEKIKEIFEGMRPNQEEKTSFMNTVSLQFKNEQLEGEYHKEMDQWFIPALAISIFYLVIFGIYHMLVMPRLITSLALIVLALTMMFVILLMLYINYFHSFSQFITRTSSGHSITIALIMTVLFLCGIVNTFSCPLPEQSDVCQRVHFSAFSFAIWMLTASVFIRFSSIYLSLMLLISLVAYGIQIVFVHPHPMGPKEFATEFDLLTGLVSLCLLILMHIRRCEKLMRLDFLSVVKMLINYKGVEKIKNFNRFYVIAVGLLPDAAQNVNETPWTIGELLYKLSSFLLDIVMPFSAGNDFHVQIGVDCGSALSIITDVDRPNYNLWGETVERARTLMMAASHGSIYVSEEIYLALRPRPLKFSNQPVKITNNLSAYKLHTGLRADSVASPDNTMPKEEQERHIQDMFAAATMHANGGSNNNNSNTNQRSVVDTQTSELASSMASSFSSELQSMDGDAETDSDIEWVTPEMALMNSRSESRTRYAQPAANGPKKKRVLRTNWRDTDYDPYREPYQSRSRNANDSYKNEHALQYSDWSEAEGSRANSRASSNRKWRGTSKSSLRNAFGFLKKGQSTDIESVGDPAERLQAAANRVDRMLQELNAYGDFSDVRPLEYRPFPTTAYGNNATGPGGSLRSLNRAMSSACHTEYDNAESEAALSDLEGLGKAMSAREKRKRKWGAVERKDDESQESSMASSMDLEPLRWKSVHSIGYENEYEMSDPEGLAIQEMQALSRDIRRNFGDFQLATFEDIGRD
ncbi:hypothetical protein WR25_04528 [Diploscapter pachys]|uniref:adenylate cyclase n=1 Tax=Diploscapter pachys TaxID=2018661 RepID=A0A2A2LFX1_9BILA|nr:hypothetical protein WR25_04528 [Diploscapter pachys]